MDTIISRIIVNDLPLSSSVVNNVNIDDLSSKLMQKIQLGYDKGSKLIVLSAGDVMTSVSCDDFMVDGMLSTAELCGTTLVLTFNTDAGSDPISIQLSSFIDDYETQISDLSNQISALSDEILSNDEFLSTVVDSKIFIDGLSTQTLSIVNISYDDFYDKVITSSLLSNELYIVSGDYINIFGKQIKNLSGPTDLNDAVNKEYVDDISVQLGNSIDSKIFIDGLSTWALSAVHINQEDFYTKVITSSLLSNELYIVSSEYINAYGQQIKNLSAPTDLSDAATKGYVDDSLSNAIRNQISSYLDKSTGGNISSDVGISGFLSVGENIAHGTSLTSGIGVGDNNGNPAEVEMSAVHGAAFNSSKALGLSSFAANKGNAYAKYSAAFNDGTAYSSYSLAHGTKTSAFGYVSHVEGEYTQTGLPEQIGNSSSRQTYGAFSHAEGDHAKAIGLASHAEGQSTYALSSWSHAEGSQTSAFGSSSHSEGQSTYALSSWSHAEGSQTSAFGSSSHSEGYKTTTAGDCSHAEGDQTYAEGQKSHAEGGETSAFGFASHAEGRSTIARASYSHAEGVKSETLKNDIYSYVWQGGRAGQPLLNINWYQSRGEGTFNINPVNGLSGFFIGKDNFIQCVLSAVQKMSDAQKNALKNALGLS